MKILKNILAAYEKYFNKGTALVNLGRYTEAEKVFRKAKELHAN